MSLGLTVSVVNRRFHSNHRFPILFSTLEPFDLNFGPTSARNGVLSDLDSCTPLEQSSNARGIAMIFSTLLFKSFLLCLRLEFLRAALVVLCLATFGCGPGKVHSTATSAPAPAISSQRPP